MLEAAVTCALVTLGWLGIYNEISYDTTADLLRKGHTVQCVRETFEEHQKTRFGRIFYNVGINPGTELALTLEGNPGLKKCRLAQYRKK